MCYYNEIAALKRPKLLMAAVKAALPYYRKDCILKKILGDLSDLTMQQMLTQLLTLEAACENARKAATGYSAVRHIETLVALIKETQHLRAAPLKHVA